MKKRNIYFLKIVSLIFLFTSSALFCAAAQQSKHPRISRGLNFLFDGTLTTALQFTTRDTKDLRTLHSAYCTTDLIGTKPSYSYIIRQYSISDQTYKLTIESDNQTAKSRFEKLDALFGKQQ